MGRLLNILQIEDTKDRTQQYFLIVRPPSEYSIFVWLNRIYHVTFYGRKGGAANRAAHTPLMVRVPFYGLGIVVWANMLCQRPK